MDFQEWLSWGIKPYKESTLELAEALEYAKENKETLMGGELSWVDFLAQPEVGLTSREATRLSKLLNLVRGMSVPISELNLSTANFVASKGMSVDGLEEDMKVLATKDFKDRHYDVSVGEDNAPRTYTYMVMKRCDQTGNLTRAYGDEVKEAIQTLEVEE